MKRSLKSALAITLLVIMSMAFAWSVSADENPYGTFVGPDAILFRDENGNISIWTPDEDDNWYVAIAQTANELDAVVTDDEAYTLIESYGSIDLYELSTGEYQVNNGPDAEGKVHVVVFDSNFNEVNHYTYSVFSAEVSEE